MKVFHYLPHLFLRETGPGSVILALSRAQARMGADVQLVFDRSAVHMPLPDDLECVGLEHRFRGKMRRPVGFRSIPSDADVLVLHGGWTMANVSAGRSARAMRIPYLVCPHGNYYPEVLARRPLRKRVWLAAFDRRTLNSALGVHLFFPEEVDHLSGLGVKSPTLIAPNGLDIPNDVVWDGGSGGYLLWYGRFDVGQKGIDLLLQALALISPDRRPALRLHGPDWRDGRTVIRNLAKELELEPWITVGEPIYGADKWATLAQAKAFTYPSLWDACPVAVAESVAAGVPTLVTDYPLGRLLSREGGAIMVDRTAQELSGGIQQVMSDQAAETGRRGAGVAAEMLNWDAIARSWLSQVDTLLEARKSQTLQGGERS